MYWVSLASPVPLSVRTALCVAVLVAACGTGISRDQAVERAVREAGPGATAAISVESGPLGAFVARVPSDDSQDHKVWAVWVAGSFEGECVFDPATQGSLCPPMTSKVLVVLDFVTGQFILSRSAP